jgi:hypothetical protein
VHAIRRPLSALFALLYLLLAAGGEALQHGGGDAGPSFAEAHLHAPGDDGSDCPPPPHDEAHCPTCKLSGLRFLPTEAEPVVLADVWTRWRLPSASDETAPALRSHAPPSSRAPPLG